jgi:formate/nitrite transporter FocA (FNT family)
MVFVLSGYEPSIANMYFLPAGLLAEGRFFAGFGSMFANLVPVTLGNVVEGLLVVVPHPARARRLARLLRSPKADGSDTSGK